MSATTLFIYGSFTNGHVHYRKIQPFVEIEAPAVAHGTLYQLEVGYPVFLANQKMPVTGFLAHLKNSELILPMLDEFHGFNPKNPEKSFFVRTAISADLRNGEIVSTYVYAINPSRLPKTAKIIMNGDWEAESKNSTPLTQALTENQRRYILKLGASSGRDIVPINLELYRELMNRGLIVDKGRRLALTSLGKEVYRYLQE